MADGYFLSFLCAQNLCRRRIPPNECHASGILDQPEVCEDLNMKPIPNHNIPNYAQKNGLYLNSKRYVRNDKMRLDRFMEFANITRIDLDGHTIVFPDFYEIYPEFYESMLLPVQYIITSSFM
jgi:hypothetical protein